MSPAVSEDYIISNDDISAIVLLEESPLPFCELTNTNHFGTQASSLKLITLLSYFGQLNSLQQLSKANVEKNQLSELAELEICLYLCAVRGFQASDNVISINGIEIRWIINGDQRELAAHFQRANIVAIAIIIKHLCMWGHSELARSLLSDIDPNAANCVLTHLLSVSTLFGKGITRLPQGDLLNRWHSFFESLSKLLQVFSQESTYYLHQNYIYFLSRAQCHQNAYDLVKKYRNENPRLYAFVQMRKALSEKKISRAIDFADKLIFMKEPSHDVIKDPSPFDRNVAEKALCDVNSLLRGAGIDAFIISGTLLGCIRDGRIFEHDKDFDLGIIGWEEQFKVAQVLLSSPIFSFSARELKGHELFLLPVVHVPSGYSFDIFFFHDDGHKFKHAIQSRLGYTIQYKFSKFELSERAFLGQNFLIPSDYELFLDENYGKGWRVPDPNYFVKLESPALVNRTGENFAYSIRHEMLDMLGKRSSPDKGKIFVEKIKIYAQRKDYPKAFVINAFLKKLVQWDKL